jgi:hypothetical protein
MLNLELDMHIKIETEIHMEHKNIQSKSSI